MRVCAIAILTGVLWLPLPSFADPARIDVERAIQDIDTAHPNVKSAATTLERRRATMNQICGLGSSGQQQCRAENASNPDYCTCSYHAGLVSSSIAEVENAAQSTKVTVSRARGLVDQLGDDSLRSQFSAAKARADAEIAIADAFVDAARQDRQRNITR